MKYIRTCPLCKKEYFVCCNLVTKSFNCTKCGYYLTPKDNKPIPEKAKS